MGNKITVSDDDKKFILLIAQAGAAAFMVFLLLVRWLAFIDSQLPVPVDNTPSKIHHSRPF